MRFGEYDIDSKLATGGMSEVFLAHRDGADQEKLVIKRMLPALAEDHKFVELFEEEARISKLMHHPNVVRIIDSGTVDGQPYIAMEHVDGLDCWRMVHRCAAAGQPVPSEASIFVVCEILRALDHVHTAMNENGEALKIIHGDVSPTNIYISRSGEVKLGDFGIARARHRDLSETVKSRLRGKVAYMAPEQVMGTKVDHRADLFSAGTVLTELLIQTRLFGGGSQLTTLLAIRDVRLDVMEQNLDKLPEGLEQILRRALTQDPDDRFPTSLSMCRMLERLLEPWTRDQLRSNLAELVEIAIANSQRSKDSMTPSVHPLAGRRDELKRDITPPKGSEELVTNGLTEGILDAPIVDDFLQGDAPSWEPLQVDAAASPAKEETPPPIERPGTDPALRETPVQMEAPNLQQFADDEQLVQEELVIDIDDTGFEIPVQTIDAADGEAQYTFRRADGSILGPMTHVAAVEKVIADQIRSHYEVSVSGGPFRPLVEVRELARHAPSLTPITTEFATIGPPDRRGLINEDEPVWVVFQSLAQAKETGLVIFDQEVVRKEVYVKDGNLHYVSSNVSSELLGKSLVNKGELSPQELDRALGALSRFNNHLGDALVGLHLVEPVTLFRYIQSQVKDKLFDIFSWRHGEYMLYRGVEDPDAAFPLHISIQSILWTGVEQGIKDVEARSWLADHETWTIAPTPDAAAILDQLELPESVTSVLSLISRPMSVRLAANMSGDEDVELDVARALILTSDLEALQLRPETPRSSSVPQLDEV